MGNLIKFFSETVSTETGGSDSTLIAEEVDSYKSESERACTHSEASSAETGGSGATRRAV